MNFLFLRIENQWGRYDLDNSEPFDAQSQIEEDDNIDLIKLKSAIKNDILKNLTDLAYAPAFGLSDIIENPTDIKNALCSFEFTKDDDSSVHDKYTVSVAIRCDMDSCYQEYSLICKSV